MVFESFESPVVESMKMFEFQYESEEERQRLMEQYQRTVELNELIIMSSGVPCKRSKLEAMTYITDQMLQDRGTSIGNGYDFHASIVGVISQDFRRDLQVLHYNLLVGVTPESGNFSFSDWKYQTTKASISSSRLGAGPRFREKLEEAERGLHKRVKKKWRALAKSNRRDVESDALNEFLDRNPHIFQSKRKMLSELVDSLEV